MTKRTIIAIELTETEQALVMGEEGRTLSEKREAIFRRGLRPHNKLSEERINSLRKDRNRAWFAASVFFTITMLYTIHTIAGWSS